MLISTDEVGEIRYLKMVVHATTINPQENLLYTPIEVLFITSKMPHIFSFSSS